MGTRRRGNDQNEVYEQIHVHEVYNSIASHFSQTRYKPWPVAERFLKDLPPSSVGVDVGCGNGKYLAVRDDLFIVGSDRSDELVKIARQHDQHDVLVGDALNPPHPTGRFDFAISIAVLHHLSTRERRVQGVVAVLELLKPSTFPVRSPHSQTDHKSTEDGNASAGVGIGRGQALFFVWALEQKGSRRGWDEGGEQDVLVPWVLKPTVQSSRNDRNRGGKGKTKDGKIVGDAGDRSLDSFGDDAQSGAAPEASEPKYGGERTKQVYQRYYHLYRQGELEEDIVTAGGEVVNCGYDRDNWWCIARPKLNVTDQ